MTDAGSRGYAATVLHGRIGPWPWPVDELPPSVGGRHVLESAELLAAAGCAVLSEGVLTAVPGLERAAVVGLLKRHLGMRP